MARGPTRIHRLPQRLDYILIPAPLDLTLPLVDEKSPLPAIIVTPSSPISPTDFSIAFLAPLPKPSLRQRVMSILPSWMLPSSPIALPISPISAPSKISYQFKARTTIITVLLLVVLAFHLVTHRMAIQGPRMELDSAGSGLEDVSNIAVSNNQKSGNSIFGGWFSSWNADSAGDRIPDFVISERAGT